MNPLETHVQKSRRYAIGSALVSVILFGIALWFDLPALTIAAVILWLVAFAFALDI